MELMAELNEQLAAKVLLVKIICKGATVPFEISTIVYGIIDDSLLTICAASKLVYA